ncbi:Ig-like domain-containing protein [Pyxidicoccus sp. MSG2]|uniref:Ig-like domain-containing protein n=1 Tax=Pyxidicoccus sp. MSG2 TaxID=2996790 RepID=UPI0022705CB0|nr:Ig-like domain-containing protein [Pyxidicoccus sp. MSG2]MCY1021946.1 Ig-like domain-containing protein [Pyxidicoccus sp. MSG2]
MDPFEGWALKKGSPQLPKPLPMPEPLAPTDDAVESFEALDAEAAELSPEARVDSPVTTCPLTWLEITVFDEDGDPVPDVSFEASLPDGSTHKGTLDSQGRAKIKGTDVEAEDVDVEVSVRRAEDGGAASYSLSIRPRASSSTEKSEDAEAPSDDSLLRAELEEPER